MGQVINRILAVALMLTAFFALGISTSCYAAFSPAEQINIVNKAYKDSGDVNELDLFAPQFNLECLNLDTASSIKGMCWWYKVKCCWGISVKPSFIVSHLVPEVITEVTATDNTHLDGAVGLAADGFKWLEEGVWGVVVKEYLKGSGMSSSSANIIKKAGFGGGNKIEKKPVQAKQGLTANVKTEGRAALNYYDVRMFANPVYPMVQQAVNAMGSSLGFNLCDSELTMYQPVFSSRASIEWQLGVWEAAKVAANPLRAIQNKKMSWNIQMEGFEDLAKSVNEAGERLPEIPGFTNGKRWGWIYPRTAFIENLSPYQGAATIAQRAADIVGGDDSGLQTVVTKLSRKPRTTSKFRYFSTSYIHEKPEGTRNKDSEHTWQMLYPIKSKQCKRFPTKTEEIPSADNSYVWLLWKRYKCCSDRGHYLSSINW